MYIKLTFKERVYLTASLTADINRDKEDGKANVVAPNILGKIGDLGDLPKAVPLFCSKVYLAPGLVFIRAFNTEQSRRMHGETHADWIPIRGKMPTGVYREQGVPSKYTAVWFDLPV